MIYAGIIAIENMLIAPMFLLCHLKSFSSSYDRSPYPETLSMILKRNLRDCYAFKSLLFDDYWSVAYEAPMPPPIVDVDDCGELELRLR